MEQSPPGNLPTAGLRVYTNESIAESPTWQRETRALSLWPEAGSRLRPVNALRNAWRVRRQLTRDDVCILTDDHALTGSLYGLLQSPGNRRPTIVRTDPYLHRPRARILAGPKKLYLRWTLRAVDRLIVWAPAIVDRYERFFGFPRAKMVPVRFHHTLTGYPTAEVSEGDYIFSGGDSMRDYATLVEAVRGCGVPVVIATRLPLHETMAIPENVSVRPVSAQQFRNLMAGARIVVCPLRMDMIRTSGQQSYLNAMALGKAVIVTDTEDAPFYIEHGRTGVVTPSRDAGLLREAIVELLDEPRWRASLGEAAREAALAMDQEATWSEVLRIAREAHALRRRGE